MLNLTRIVTPAFFRLAAIVFFAFGLAACNNSVAEAPKTENATSEVMQTAAAETTETEAGVKKMVNGDENTLLLDLKNGRVVIQLRPDLAPKHVAQIKALTKKGFYDGIVFHRVIDGFMAQTGDPTGTGTGGSELPDIQAEFSSEPFKRGILGMARSQSPNSANSQFFIMFADGDFLNNKYTVFGEVTKGMEFVDGIKRGEGSNGQVSSPDKIVKMQLASDAN